MPHRRFSMALFEKLDRNYRLSLSLHTGEFINQNERRPITLIEKKGKEQLAQEEISQERGEERKE